MATKDRSAKKKQFKEKKQKEAAQQRIPRTHLVPVPTWQSNENLDFRGDLLEATQQQLFAAMESLQRIGQVMNMLMQENIKSEKIKIDYVWNNGEKPTEAEVTAFKAEVEKAQAQRQKEALALQQQIQQNANAAKTGLVGPDGEPVGTTQNLEEDDDQDEDMEALADESRASAEDQDETSEQDSDQ